jgi:hypothetical protein
MKRLFLQNDFTANQSSEVNANEHLENGTHCITTKKSERRRILNRWSVRNVVFAISIIMFIGSGIFYACKKEDTLKTDVKVQKSMEDDDLRAYEYYTPEESQMHGKLLSFAKCVNDKAEYITPNIELKEAIWLMEAFFNIGVCEKQKRFVKQSDSKRNYQIVVPFKGEGNNIQINGKDMGLLYSKLLQNIVEEICPEFALDFGDVYVSKIDYASRTLTLDIDVLYGTKGEYAFGQSGREIMIGPNNRPFLYLKPEVINLSDFYPRFPSYNNPDDLWIRDTIAASRYHRDPYMEQILNNIYSYYTPINIIHAKLMMKIRWSDLSFYQNEIVQCRGSYSNPVIQTPSLNTSEYEKYGEKYRDYIYNEVYPIVLSAYPSYSPFKACCFFLSEQLVSMNPPHYVWHTFGIEYLCQFSKELPTTIAPMIRFENPCFTVFSIIESPF